MLLAARVELVGRRRASGSGTSTRSSSFSRTASRAAAACSRRLPLPSRLAHVVGELVGGVELRGQLGELVVELGQLLLLDLGDLDLDLDVLADQVAADELGGEGLARRRRSCRSRASSRPSSMPPRPTW